MVGRGWRCRRQRRRLRRWIRVCSVRFDSSVLEVNHPLNFHVLLRVLVCFVNISNEEHYAVALYLRRRVPANALRR
jgi:hypothetical protein